MTFFASPDPPPPPLCLLQLSRGITQTVTRDFCPFPSVFLPALLESNPAKAGYNQPSLIQPPFTFSQCWSRRVRLVSAVRYRKLLLLADSGYPVSASAYRLLAHLGQSLLPRHHRLSLASGLCLCSCHRSGTPFRTVECQRVHGCLWLKGHRHVCRERLTKRKLPGCAQRHRK